jgi:hypothetical protein
MDFQLLDNAFVHIDDFATAQKLADALPVSKLHRRLNRFARLYCPVIRHFRSGYHWSIREMPPTSSSNVETIYTNSMNP